VDNSAAASIWMWSLYVVPLMDLATGVNRLQEGAMKEHLTPTTGLFIPMTGLITCRKGLHTQVICRAQRSSIMPLLCL
jgi:hypothetical protein